MITTKYRVAGMTCDHCAQAVTEEVSALPGVSDVQVSLDQSEVTVTSEEALETEQVRAAVDEAGYELAR